VVAQVNLLNFKRLVVQTETAVRDLHHVASLHLVRAQFASAVSVICLRARSSSMRAMRWAVSET